MDTSPVCPHCFTDIEYDDIIDSNYEVSYHDSKWGGHCPTCNKRFVWHEIYQFDHIKDFEEDVDNGQV